MPEKTVREILEDLSLSRPLRTKERLEKVDQAISAIKSLLIKAIGSDIKRDINVKEAYGYNNATAKIRKAIERILT